MNTELTIFTPTYNRAYCLPVLYQSLCRQTCQEFEWVIVDDGSVDNTRILVEQWEKEGKICIRYFWQENRGKAQAHNRGVELAEGRLFTCVDSDDALDMNGVEKIMAIWNEHPEKIGIISPKKGMDGRETTRWNGAVQYCTLYDAYRKYGLKGDAMLIYQTSIIKKYRFPAFSGEKFMKESYLYDRLDQEGVMYITKESFYRAEYLEDGYTLRMDSILRENPYGYQAYIIQRLKLDQKLKYKMIDTILYISSKRMVKNQRLLEDAVYPVLTGMLYFPSLVYYTVKDRIGSWRKRGYDPIWYLCMLLVGILFLLFFSISTSPLTSNSYGSDSAFFQMVGQSMTKGQIMYKDIFDNKGPYLFLIQYLGQIIGYGRAGIFFLQILNLCTTLYFVDHTCCILCGDHMWLRIISVLSFLFLAALTWDCGNLSEEYSLPVLFMCLYLFCKFVYRNAKRVFLYATVFGVSFGFLAFMRITNAIFLCALVAVILIELIYNRQFRFVLLCTAGFVAGFIAAVLPVCIYYAQKHLLSEMLYATFTFNYYYGIHGNGSLRFNMISILLGVAILSVWFNKRDRVCCLLAVFSTVMTICMLMLGYGYMHYYQLMIPSVLVNMWLAMQKQQKIRSRTKKICFSVMIVIGIILNSRLLFMQGGRVIFALGFNTPEREKTFLGALAHTIENYAPDWKESYGYIASNRVSEVLEQISVEERNSVYNYNTRPYWLRASGLLPYHKYCQTQESFVSINPQIEQEIDNMFVYDSPCYVVLENYEAIHNQKILERLAMQYEIKYQNEVYTLYERAGVGLSID